MTNRGDQSLSRRDLLRKGAVGTGAATVGIAAFSGTSVAGCTSKHRCARTPGFWKNHKEMWHGYEFLYLEYFTTEFEVRRRHNYFSEWHGRPSVWEILHTKPKGDKSIIMAHHLIAALLNKKAGVEWECVKPTIDKARKWLTHHPIGSDQRHWDGGEEIKDRLDAYNNGYLCACGGE